ncbi:DUF6635 family protein [uncultured Marinobacter sp.]|uniref:DUF6635 family protein n=1 Tax=uncultured Marinobacter sp. TaxID=187379 RepID=UPI0030DD99E3
MGGLQKKLDEGEVLAVIGKAITTGAERYVREREHRIDGFVRHHYSFRGALKIHRHAIGWDVVRVPVNIVWSVVNIFLALLGFVAGLVRLKKLQNWIKKIPPGLETDMDRQISWLIVTELLELPYQQGQKVSDKDALMTEILKDSELRSLLNEVLEAFSVPAKSPEFREKLDAKLAEYGATRTASADLASNATLLVTSKVALGQASFGALSAGTAVSAMVANSAAASNFWLGSSAGSYYYAVFPVAASARLFLAVTAVVAVVLALVSTFIGILTDPLQAKLGIHQKRLRKLVGAVGDDLSGEAGADFELREKYAGRLFDIVDVLSTVGRSL